MLAKLSRSTGYWLLLMLTAIAMEAIALYFQYVLDYGPCVLCIHIRILLAALILVCLLAFLLGKSKPSLVFSHFLSFLVALGLAERSWQTLGIERGFIDGACSLDSGLPSWLALDQWFPYFFEVWESCGYTPELMYGVTMAEGLMLFSAAFALLSFLLTCASLFARKRSIW